MTMKRLATPLVFAIALVLGVSSSDAQQSEKVFRVGVLQLASAKTVQHRLGVFREALRDLGYEEGRNLVIESRFANGDYDHLPVLAGELARLKVDVFFVAGDWCHAFAVAFKAAFWSDESLNSASRRQCSA